MPILSGYLFPGIKVLTFQSLCGLALAQCSLAATHDVAILDDEFAPKFLTIAPGDTVIWTNVGGSAHTVIADDGSFDSTASGMTSIPASGTFSHTFPSAGRNPYYCQLHGSPGGLDMAGVIRVAEPGANNPPQAPINLSPANAATAQSTAPTLSASTFVDPDAGDIHLASQWIVSKSATGETVLDSGEDATSKTSLPMTGLLNGTSYSWTVRYKDDRGEWSAYSAVTEFTTISLPPTKGTGLTASYGRYSRKLGTAMFSFTTVDSAIDFAWGLGKPNATTPANNFAVLWEGTVLPEFSERYRFRVRADGGIRLWVNEALLIDDYVAVPFPIYRNHVATLQAGVPVPIKVEYFDTTGEASIDLRWSSPSQRTEVIPQTRLFPLQP